MSEADEDVISRILDERGTTGLALMIGEVCEEKAESDDEPGAAEFWIREGVLFRTYDRLPHPESK